MTSVNVRPFQRSTAYINIINFIKEEPNFKKKVGQLFFQGRFHEVKDILLKNKIREKWALNYLHVITSQIEKNSPPKTKIKKTIPEKLVHNLSLAQKQQQEEQEKCTQFDLGEIHSTLSSLNKRKCEIKHQLRKINEKLVGIAECQGGKDDMEDTTLTTEFLLHIAEKEYKAELYGIFDGHGGKEASQFVSENLTAYLIKTLKKNNPYYLTDNGIYQALYECFINLDQATLHIKSGTTATLALILANKLWCTNVGDSRMIVSQEGLAIQLSQDGKLSEERFFKKVKKLEGNVIKKDILRLHGIDGPPYLGVAGAIGDRYILGKSGKCCIPAYPQITHYSLTNTPNSPTNTPKYLILFSDGISDVYSTNGISMMLSSTIDRGESNEEIAKRFIYNAIQNGSIDNISFIIVPVG